MNKTQIDDDRLDTAVEAAVKSGDNASKMKDGVDVETKDNASLVTEADKKSERIARDVLVESRFTDEILGEEYGNGDVDDNTYWVIDPIDGTTNYTFANPIYGSAIALVENGDVVCGAFYMPEIDYLFYAVRGEGAYKNDERLQIDDEFHADPVVGVTGKGQEKYVPHIDLTRYDLREHGSALVNHCWLAGGWMTSGIASALAPWDMAVGQVMVREAGGVMKHVTTRGTSWEDIQNGRVVVGKEERVDELLNHLGKEGQSAIESSEYDY